MDDTSARRPAGQGSACDLPVNKVSCQPTTDHQGLPRAARTVLNKQMAVAITTPTTAR